jgi:hypothetical protein
MTNPARHRIGAWKKAIIPVIREAIEELSALRHRIHHPLISSR